MEANKKSFKIDLHSWKLKKNVDKNTLRDIIVEGLKKRDWLTDEDSEDIWVFVDEMII